MANPAFKALWDDLDTLKEGVTEAVKPLAHTPSKNPNITPEFIGRLNEVASNIGVNPRDLYQVMQFESGINPSRRNIAGSGATGLIQFMPSTAKGLGTTTDNLARMSSTQQLDYVQKYFQNQGYKPGRQRSQSDLYMSVLYPAAVGKPEDYSLFKQGTTAYRQNAGLDTNKDGRVTKQEASVKVFKTKGRDISAPVAQGQQSYNVPDLPNVPQAYGDINDIYRQISQGQPIQPSQEFNQATDTLNQQLKDFETKYQPPTAAVLNVKPPAQDQTDNFKALRDQLTEINKPVPVAPQQPQDTNFLGDLTNRVINAASGYTRDDLVRQSGQGVGATVGDFLGGLVPVGAGAASGAGLGALTFTPFGVAGGAFGGGIVGAGAAGAAQDLQMQRLSGIKNPDLLRTGGAALIQGGLQAIPGLKGGNLLTSIGKNVAVQGGGAAIGDLAQQAIEQRSLTPNIDLERLKATTALGAAGGAVGGALEGRAPREIAPDLSNTPRYGFINREIEARRLNQQMMQDAAVKPEQANTPQATEELSNAFINRSGASNPERPQRNLDRRILDSQGREILPQETGRLKSSYEIALERSRPQEQTATPVIERASGLPSGRTDVQGGNFEPNRTPAQKSGDVLFSYQQDLDAAQQLRNDALTTLQSKEQELTRSANATDVAEAQRTFGQRINELESKAAQQALTESERQELSYRRNLFDSVQTARRELLDSEQLLKDSQQVTPRSSIETPSREITSRSIETPTPETTIGRQPNLPRDLSPQPTKPASREITSGLLDAQGRPISRNIDAQPLELPGQRPEPGAAPEIIRTGSREIMPNERPSSKPEPTIITPDSQTKPAVTPQTTEHTHTTTQGKEVFHQGRTPDEAQAIADKIQEANRGGQNQLANFEDAQSLLIEKQRAGLLDNDQYNKQLDALRLAIEAGRTGRTLNLQRREIKEGLGSISRSLGKREVKARDDLNPFAIHITQRKATTEVGNLVRELGTVEAARDRLRTMASQYGITPTTQGKTIRANAVRIADQIRNHPKGSLYFKDVYLDAHNFKTGGEKTAFDAPRGYPLRTLEGAGIGDKSSAIPKQSVNQNRIKQQFDDVRSIIDSGVIKPEASAKLDRILNKPEISRTDLKSLRKAIEDTKVLQEFCNIFGLK